MSVGDPGRVRMSVGEPGRVRSQSTKVFANPKRQRIELLGFTGRSRSFSGEVQLKCIWESFYGKFRAWEPLRTFLEGDPAVWGRFLKDDLSAQPAGNDIGGLSSEEDSSDDGRDENAEKRSEEQGKVLRVERVIAYAELADGAGVILCKWKGRSLGCASWEPLKNVVDKVGLYDQIEAAQAKWSMRTRLQPSTPLFFTEPSPVLKVAPRSQAVDAGLHSTPAHETPQLDISESSQEPTVSSGNPFSPPELPAFHGNPQVLPVMTQSRRLKHSISLPKIADVIHSSKDLYEQVPSERKTLRAAPLPSLPANPRNSSTGPQPSSALVSRALELAEWFGEKSSDGMSSGTHHAADRAPPPALIARDLVIVREKLKVLSNANHFDSLPPRIQTEVRLGLPPEASIRKKVVESPRAVREKEIRDNALKKRFLLPQVTGGEEDEGKQLKFKEKHEVKATEPADLPRSRGQAVIREETVIRKETSTNEETQRVVQKVAAVPVTEDTLRNRLWTDFVKNSKRMQLRLGTRILNNKGLVCVCDRSGSLYPIFREIFERPECQEWIPPDSEGVECSICGVFSHFPCFAKSLEFEYSSIAFKKKLRKPEDWVTPDLIKKWVTTFVCLVCAIAQGDPFFPVEDILQIDWLAPVHTGNFFKAEPLAPRAPKSDIVLPVELDRESAQEIKNGSRCLQLRSFRLKADHSSYPKFPNDEVEIWFLQSREKTVERLKKPPSFRIRQDFFRLLPASYATDITRPQSVKVIADFESAYDGPYVVCLVKTRARLDFPEIFGTLKRSAVVPYKTCHTLALNHLFPPDSDQGKNVTSSHDDADDLSILRQDHRVKLTCPSTLVQIRTPARGFRCRHTQCFDLEFFLESAIHVHHFLRWQCPICRLYCRPHELLIDSWMQSILSNSQEKTEVSLDVLVDEAEGTRSLYIPKSQSALTVPVFSL